MKGSRWDQEADFVIVGSGAGGATAAVVLAEGGRDVLVLEEGARITRENFTPDVYGAMRSLFRSFGNQASQGSCVMPVLEGACVGGSTVMNGAIIHRFPDDVWNEWLMADRGLDTHFGYADIEAASAAIEKDLGVGKNLAAHLPTLPVHHVLDKLGWEHDAMARNAPGCEGSGRCLQGCPSGGKWSLEKTYLPRAEAAGARLWPRHRVERVLMKSGRATGVACTRPDGSRVFIRARLGVIVAAGAIQTPLLLRRSGLGGDLVGKNFQCHLGVAIAAEMPKPVRGLEGPPQGIEIHAFRDQGVKLATQLVPPELVLTRTPLRGEALTRALGRLDHYTTWMGSIRSEARGLVSPGILGGPKISFSPTERDIARARQALYHLATLLFEMGAREVYPGLHGPETLPLTLRAADEAKRILEVPLDARYYWFSAGHLFGTCGMASDAERGVIDNEFGLHGLQGLSILDASAFPTNLGVNPQHSVMALSRLGAERLLGVTSR